MRRSVRVQMLLTDAFGSLGGGISQFNRDFLAALNACSSVERVHALPRLITEPIEEVVPEAIIFNRKAARGRIAFTKHSFFHTASVERLEVGLDAAGKPVAWLHRTVAPTIRSTFTPDPKHEGPSELAMGGVDMPFAIPNVTRHSVLSVTRSRIY
jgi:hypothetical protein